MTKLRGFLQSFHFRDIVYYPWKPNRMQVLFRKVKLFYVYLVRCSILHLETYESLKTKRAWLEIENSRAGKFAFPVYCFQNAFLIFSIKTWIICQWRVSSMVELRLPIHSSAQSGVRISVDAENWPPIHWIWIEF